MYYPQKTENAIPTEYCVLYRDKEIPGEHSIQFVMFRRQAHSRNPVFDMKCPGSHLALDMGTVLVFLCSVVLFWYVHRCVSVLRASIFGLAIRDEITTRIHWTEIWVHRRF